MGVPDPEQLIRSHWDTLLSILERHYFILKEVENRYPRGPRVTPERGRELLEITHRHLVSLTQRPTSPPRLQFVPFSSGLMRTTLVFTAIILSLVGLLCFVILGAHARGLLSQREMVLLLFPVCSLLYLPFPVYRRTRINMEHRCLYRREGNVGYIVIGDLREGMFISFCAHEMAHHFLREGGKGGGLWEEGWARWVQLKVSEVLSRECGVDALAPFLTLLLGELKEALILTRGDRHLPSWVGKVKSPFHSSSFVRWIKGEPGHSRRQLFIHALGTAAFALLMEFRGDRVLKEFMELGFGIVPRVKDFGCL